jgi:hypothetical protein
MSDDQKVSITKLIVDGSNWVTYCDRTLWAIGSCNLSIHLTEPTITQAYTTAGNVGVMTPQERWNTDQSIVKQLITSSVPDSVFNSIKTGTSTKAVWDVLKALFEGRTTLILVDLGRRLQTTHCAEEDSVCDHFENLADLREQLCYVSCWTYDHLLTSHLCVAA